MTEIIPEAKVTEASLQNFNATLWQYLVYSRKSVGEVMVKQGAKLAATLADKLRGITPGKGEITRCRLSLLKERKEGLGIRESVKTRIAARYRAATNIATRKIEIGRGKKNRGGSVMIKDKNNPGAKRRLNLQALMVAAELRLRERGRGYTAHGSRLRGLAQVGISGYAMSKMLRHFGRFNQELLAAGISIARDRSSLRFTWGNDPKTKIATSMNRPQAMRHLVDAFNEVSADMWIYINRKMAGLPFVRAK